MYHFVWADQREKQGYKCDVSLKRGIQTEKQDTNDLYPGKSCHSLYRHNKTTIDCGFEFVNNIESRNLNLVIKCFLMGMGFLSHGGLGAWFLTDLENGSRSAVPNS